MPFATGARRFPKDVRAVRLCADTRLTAIGIAGGIVNLAIRRPATQPVSVREGPNMRQTFDGGSVVVQKGRWRVDGFGARYVSTEDGAFDEVMDSCAYGTFHCRSSSTATACFGFLCSNCSSTAIPSFERPALKWIFASVT